MTLSTFATTSASLTLTTGGLLSLQPGTNQVLTGLKGWHSSPGTRRASTPRLWAHGSFSERGWRSERVITVSGYVYCETRSDAAAMTDTLNAALADGTEGRLTVDDADLGRRWATVYMTGEPTVEWDGARDIVFVVDMVAPDPRKYGDWTSVSTPAASPGGGLVFDLFTSGTGLDFGPSGNPGTVTLTNPGTADTAPVFKVTGYAPGFTITEVASGARLIYSQTVPAGQSITLDANDGSVLLEGYADRSAYLTRREWSRIEGRSSATYLFESLGNSGASMTVGVNPAWW